MSHAWSSPTGALLAWDTQTTTVLEGLVDPGAGMRASTRSPLRSGEREEMRSRCGSFFGFILRGIGNDDRGRSRKDGMGWRGAGGQVPTPAASSA
jgi:hypothetical protein